MWVVFLAVSRQFGWVCGVGLVLVWFCLIAGSGWWLLRYVVLTRLFMVVVWFELVV